MLPEALIVTEATFDVRESHNCTRTFETHITTLATGTAPVFGPCGSMGGMPLGCDNDGEGSFGDCCSGNCDAFALGGNAEAYQGGNSIGLKKFGDFLGAHLGA